MYNTSCSTIKKRLLHDLGPEIHILQLASDGGSSLYQVQVNGIPEGELHMETLDSGYFALVRYERKGERLGHVRINIVEEGWLFKAHRIIEEMLRAHYSNASIGWYTRGANVE